MARKLGDARAWLQGQGIIAPGKTAAAYAAYAADAYAADAAAYARAALDAGGGPDELRDAQEQTYAGTRRYVRRQRSWFRRDHRVRWIDAADRARIVDGAVRAWRQVP